MAAAELRVDHDGGQGKYCEAHRVVHAFVGRARATGTSWMLTQMFKNPRPQIKISESAILWRGRIVKTFCGA